MPQAMNATARETDAMTPVALLTPTYGRDLELCTLLCESVDRHVKSFLEALSAGSGLRPVVVLAFRKRAQGRASRLAIPARMAAAAAAHHSAQAPPVLVVVARQAGERLACPAAHQDCGRDVAAPRAILHPRLRHRVLSRFRSVALRISEHNSASEHAQTRSRRTSSIMRAGSRPAMNCLACRCRRCRHRISSAISSSGISRRRRRWPRRSKRSTGLDWIEALCRTREFSEYMLYGYFVENDAGFSARHISRAPHPVRQLLGRSRNSTAAS